MKTRAIRRVKDWRALALGGLLACACAPAHVGMARFVALPEPVASAPPVSVEVIHEGHAVPLLRALADDRAGTLDVVRLEMSAVLVRHGGDLLLVDAGLASDLDAQMQAMHGYQRLALGVSGLDPTAKQLAAHGIALDKLQIAITHLHYDHASGIPELAPAPVLVRQEELDAFRAPDAVDHGYVASMLAGADARLRPVRFTDGPVLVFASSKDLYGDGTVRLVPMGGHTPGSMGVLVRAGTRTLLFVGDVVWLESAVEHRGGRGVPTRNLTDYDWRQVREWVGLLAELRERAPDVEIIPAHDPDALATLPSLR